MISGRPEASVGLPWGIHKENRLSHELNALEDAEDAAVNLEAFKINKRSIENPSKNPLKNQLKNQFKVRYLFILFLY